SPSRAPPENGDDGSTASTPTRRPAFRYAVTSADVEVDLPTPGEPVSPTTYAPPVSGASAAITSRSCGEAPSTREISRATARGLPSRAWATSSETSTTALILPYRGRCRPLVPSGRLAVRLPEPQEPQDRSRRKRPERSRTARARSRG